MELDVVTIYERHGQTTYLSTKEFAARIGVSRSTVRRWIRRIHGKERGLPRILRLLKITYFTNGEGRGRRWYVERASATKFKRALRSIAGA